MTSDIVDFSKRRKVVFPLTVFESIKMDTERRGYLVKGLLPESGLGVIWGAPKSYKSFFAIDLALHIAAGLDYRGRKVEQRSVIYIGLEGRWGLPARIEAFRRQHDISRAMFSLITSPLNLKRQVDILISDISAQTLTDPGVVVIDTLTEASSAPKARTRTCRLIWPPPPRLANDSNASFCLCTIAASMKHGHEGTHRSQLRLTRSWP
jgi:AAA domain